MCDVRTHEAQDRSGPVSLRRQRWILVGTPGRRDLDGRSGQDDRQGPPLPAGAVALLPRRHPDPDDAKPGLLEGAFGLRRRAGDDRLGHGPRPLLRQRDRGQEVLGFVIRFPLRALRQGALRDHGTLRRAAAPSDHRRKRERLHVPLEDAAERPGRADVLAGAVHPGRGRRDGRDRGGRRRPHGPGDDRPAVPEVVRCPRARRDLGAARPALVLLRAPRRVRDRKVLDRGRGLHPQPIDDRGPPILQLGRLGRALQALPGGQADGDHAGVRPRAIPRRDPPRRPAGREGGRDRGRAERRGDFGHDGGQ